MNPEGKSAPPGRVGQAQQGFARGKNCLLRAVEDCGGTPAAAVDWRGTGGGVGDRQKAGRSGPVGPSPQQWAEAVAARPREVAWAPFRASWGRGTERAQPDPRLASAPRAPARWKAGLPAAPVKGRWGHSCPRGQAARPASGLLSAVPPCFLWALWVRRERREVTAVQARQSPGPCPREGVDGPAGQGSTRGPGPASADERRGTASLPSGGAWEVLASEPGLEAGEGVDGRAGAWDPCRRQKVAGRKARMGRRAPGRPAGWPT